ncbi:MAG: imidazole glycerol phosphate synthase cyclase subunit [Candidatus Melainabacteria bacterium]|nr:imidazole glycerol phosphate synthase cyclase subunit [Candidatus Melainabacteria bacterium]
MLKTRIIPTLLWKDLGLVKGVGFDSWRRVGTVLPAIKVYNRRNVDELVLLDITATADGREPDYESVAEFCQESFVPMAVGGGIRSLAHIQGLLRAGADKVVINTAAYSHPELITQAAQRYGSQCVVVSIDVLLQPEGTYLCKSHAAQQNTAYTPVEWAKTVEALGAGEILLTSIVRDGTMAGYDLDLLQQVSAAVSIPVIAAGGAGTPEHCLQALTAGGSSAIAAASLFHFTEQTPLEIKQYLHSQGIPVRLTQ